MNYTKFTDRDVRLQTFVFWDNLKNKNDLVESGFFFLGGKDVVQCYHCGVKLHTWKDTDNIDIQHLKYSPSCDHVRRKILKPRESSLHTWTAVFESLNDIRQDLNDLKMKLSNMHRNCCSGTEDEVD